jgi:tetratricopeptide (TPR) repeat protein
MSYTRYFPLALLILTGCSSVTPRHVAPESPAVTESLNTSAEGELGLYRQAITSLNNQQLDQAESELKAITKARPEFAGPWINLALVDIKHNDLAGAEKNLATARDRNPKMPQIYNMLGFIETSRGNIGKAVDYYKQALILKDDYAIAHYNFALLNDIFLQDMKVAVQHYKRYLELTDYQDRKTAEWVAELERSLTKGGP